MAYGKKVIDENFYKKLNSLYEERNKVIHRFFLSCMVYKNYEKILGKHEECFQRLRGIIDDLEKAQIIFGRGMTMSGSTISKKCKEAAKKRMHELIYKKL